MVRLETAEVTLELKLVLQSLGHALYGRVPNPDLLRKIATRYVDAVPNHRVVIEHTPKGIKNRRRAFYNISVVGKRVDAKWNFTSGQLKRLIDDVLSEKSSNA